MGFIYVITNSSNGKYYVGKTELSIKKRWDGHKRSRNCKDGLFLRALRKYGVDGFVVEQLTEETNPERLSMLEKVWITALDATNSNIAYNLATGGVGGNVRGNRPHSEETKKKMSAAHKGKKKSAEHIENIRKARTGCKDSPEGRLRKSIARSGAGNPMFGKKRSAETIRKIVESQRLTRTKRMAKDQLIELSLEDKDPYRVTGSDFPAAGGTGPSAGSGMNQLISLSDGQCSPGCLADSGDDSYRGPSEWGKEGRAFNVSTNKGESNGKASNPGMKFGVDMVGGQVAPNVKTDRL